MVGEGEGLLGSKVELATRLKGLIYQKRGARVAFISALNNLSLGIVTSGLWWRAESLPVRGINRRRSYRSAGDGGGANGRTQRTF